MVKLRSGGIKSACLVVEWVRVNINMTDIYSETLRLWAVRVMPISYSSIKAVAPITPPITYYSTHRHPISNSPLRDVFPTNICGCTRTCHLSCCSALESLAFFSKPSPRSPKRGSATYGAKECGITVWIASVCYGIRCISRLFFVRINYS